MENIIYPDWFELKPYNCKELAALYRIDRRTMKNWIARYEHLVGKPTGKLYNVTQVQIIFQHMGLPGKIKEG